MKCDVCASVCLFVRLLVCLARLVHVGASCPHDDGLVQVCVSVGVPSLTTYICVCELILVFIAIITCVGRCLI